MIPIPIGVIGTGSIAQVAHIPLWKRIEGAEVVAVCDINRAKAQWVADRFKIPHAFDSDQELLSSGLVEAVDICVPTNHHMDVAVAALSAGLHVLVEKPMARNSDEARRMVEAAEQAGCQLMVAMNVRFRRDAMILKNFTAGGELGEIFFAKAGWLRRKPKRGERSWFTDRRIAGGGVLMDLGVQMLDLAMWLMGNPVPKSVKALTYNRVANLEVEDAVSALIEFANGSALSLEASWSLFGEKDVFYTNLFGTQGGALLNPLRIHKELHGSMVNVTPAREDAATNLYKRSYQNELTSFVDGLRRGQPLEPSGRESLERMLIIDAIYESSKSGSEVRL